MYRYGADLGIDDWTSWCLARVRSETALVPVGRRDRRARATGRRAGVLALDPDVDFYEDAEEFGKDYFQWHESVLTWFAEAGIEVPDPSNIRHAAVIAGRTSVDRGGLGPGTRVAGHGVLALTACGRLDGHRGAYPL